MNAKVLLLLLYSITLFSQEDNPILENVEARFVSIPDAIHAYHEGAEDYPTYEIVTLKSIWYPERDYFEWFGNVDLQDSFAIFFTGQMVCSLDGWYELSLNSDDGTILWLDEKLILDNDGNHPMRLKKDTVYLKADSYDFKIWYFQDYPMKMGVEFDQKYLKTLDKAIPKKVETIPEPKEEKIVLDAQVLFSTDSYRLSKRGREVIDSVGRILQSIKKADFLIEGHTDNTGSAKYNEKLSLKRAESVSKRIRLQSLDPSSKMLVKAYGATNPIDNNGTEEGRQRNRRVEIRILYH